MAQEREVPSQRTSPARESSERFRNASALASLGCGNHTAMAKLKPGKRVLDLGSDSGIAVLLSAQQALPLGLSVFFVNDLDVLLFARLISVVNTATTRQVFFSL